MAKATQPVTKERQVSTTLLCLYLKTAASEDGDDEEGDGGDNDDGDDDDDEEEEDEEKQDEEEGGEPSWEKQEAMVRRLQRKFPDQDKEVRPYLVVQVPGI